MRRSRFLLPLVAVGLLGTAVWAAGKDQQQGGGGLPSGVCEGVGSQPLDGSPTLDCVDWECPEPGCWSRMTETPHGQGFFCQCYSTKGPSADCCSLVYVPGAGGFTRQGDCNAKGCDTSGECVQAVIPPTQNTPGATFVNCDE